MRYIMLLWPHANVRYRNEAVRLAAAEARIMLAGSGTEIAIGEDALNGLPALSFEGELNERAMKALSRHSLMYGLFRRDGEALYPVCGREEPLLGEDLPGVLKYKGKTNELFTHMLVNVALYSSSFADEVNLQLYDPMCGRGTTLFDGVNRGWMCTGSDVDKTDLKEAEQFFKRYLEFHRRKHAVERSGRTRQGRKSAPCVAFTMPDMPGAGLRLAETDAALVRETFGRNKAQLVVCDLPYGVQHGPNGGTLDGLLRRVLPDWRELLRVGGTVAVAFNTQTLPRKRVAAAMLDSGLEPLEGEMYCGFEHWVEQAVTRDIAVAVRRR